jgi:REP element-mobilizing transposase RayT
MNRFWLLTSTFYGNWLPGDARGFIARVRDTRAEDEPREARREHDLPGTPYDEDFPGLHRHAHEEMRGPPIRIDREQAAILLDQFHETAAYRAWRLFAVAIMANHVHLVVGVEGDPDPTKILGDFKAYASRSLTRRWGKPPSDTWWTYGGSKRKLKDDRARGDAIDYVRRQPNMLVVWIDPEYDGEGGRVSAPSANAPEIDKAPKE